MLFAINYSKTQAFAGRSCPNSRQCKTAFINRATNFASFSSDSKVGTENAVISEAGETEEIPKADWRLDAVSPDPRSEEWLRKDLNLVLVEPMIPQNAGAIARTSAATGVPMHLVGPLGFPLNDKKMKRAGLDYWPHVCVKLHEEWSDFRRFFEAQPGSKRLVAFSARADTFYGAPEFQYRPGDWLLFGSERSGLSDEVWQYVRASGGALVKLPIRDGLVRSVNINVAAGVGVFEAIRQLDQGRHIVLPRDRDPLSAAAALELEEKKAEWRRNKIKIQEGETSTGANRFDD